MKEGGEGASRATHVNYVGKQESFRKMNLVASSYAYVDVVATFNENFTVS